MSKEKILFVSLGCSKNQVDLEIIISSFIKCKNYEITLNENEANIVLINSCSFIKPAKEETLSNIKHFIKLNKRIFVLGCFPVLEKDLLKKKFSSYKKIKFIGCNEYKNLKEKLNLKLNKDFNFYKFERKNFPFNFHAFVKIAEGCETYCSYCSIPFIRGKIVSRPSEEIVQEISFLVNKKNVKEVTLLAQNPCLYGKDLKGENLTSLLKKIDKIKNLERVWILYLYPSLISKDLIDVFKKSKKLVPYFDIPLQHASDRILKLMNRKGESSSYLKTLNFIKKEIPNSIFRTTFMVGFPGETESDFKEIISFINKFNFDHLGVFKYSKEKFTTSSKFKNQIYEDVKQKRYEILMNEQLKILKKNVDKFLNKKLKGYVIEINKDKNQILYRTEFNAPDLEDGNVFSDYIGNENLKIGQSVNLKIKETFIYDLFVNVIK